VLSSHTMQTMTETDGFLCADEPMKLGDGDLFNIMMRARDLGITTMIHAENNDMIEQITK
jgi:dihydroorotase-like cyclic amidohydrolase